MKNKYSFIFNTKNSFIQILIIALFIGAFIIQVFSAFGWGHESWQMTDWLINYEGGFVRRGLPGTLFLMASEKTGIYPNYLVIFFSVVIFLILLGS